MKARIYHLCLGGFVVASPALITCLLVYFSFGVTLLDFIPASVNDEIGYWHEVLTFSQVGFAGGYYTIEEQPAPFSFSHFGSYGPLYPMLYGAAGYFIGWRPFLGPLFNLALVAAALSFFLYITQPDNKQLILSGVFLATFWPVLLFLPTNMQEGLHAGLAIILAALFYVLLAKGGSSSTRFKVFSLCFIIFASFLRPSWSLLLFPFFMLEAKQLSLRHLALAGLKTLLLVYVIFFIYRYLAAPFPNVGFFFVRVLTLQSGLEAILNYAQANLISLLWWQSGYFLETYQRYQLLLLVIFLSLVGGVILWKSFKKRIKSQRLTPEEMKIYSSAPVGGPTFKGIKTEMFPLTREVFFHLCNLGGILLATLLLYIVGNWGDYRVFASHGLLSALLFVASKRKVWFGVVILVIVSNLIITPIFLDTFHETRLANFVYDQQSITAFQETVKDLIIYQDNQNAWCNTLLSTTYPYQLIALPGGIGISYVFRDPINLSFPLKSKYLLVEHDMLREDNPDHQRLRHKLKNIKLLGYTPYGNLYQNLEAHCD